MTTNHVAGCFVQNHGLLPFSERRTLNVLHASRGTETLSNRALACSEGIGTLGLTQGASIDINVYGRPDAAAWAQTPSSGGIAELWRKGTKNRDKSCDRCFIAIAYRRHNCHGGTGMSFCQDLPGVRVGCGDAGWGKHAHTPGA